MSDAATEMLKQESVDMTEIGATGLEHASGLIHEEFLRQLSGNLAKRVYREMSSNDAVIGATLFALEMLIRGVAWTVEPGGDASEDDQRAEYLSSVLDDMSHSWPSFIGEWMAAPTYGFAPFEIVYKRRLGDNMDPGTRSRYNDGRIGVRKLAIRHPDTHSRWLFDDAGGLQGMVQRASPDWSPREIPIEKLLVFTVLQRKGSPEGTSLLRRAFVSWYRKKRIEEIEAIGVERELAGLPVFTVPASWMNPNASSADKALLAEVKKIGRRIRADEQACVVIPAVFDGENNQIMKFELATTGGRRAIDTNQAKEYYSRQAAMTVLADVILLGHEKVGSFALASSKTNLFAAGLGAMLDDIQETLNRHLVPRLMRLNGWPTDERMPEFRHGDVESVDLTEIADAIDKLAGAGMSIFPTESGERERELFRLMGLPDELAEEGAPVTLDDLGPEGPPEDMA